MIEIIKFQETEKLYAKEYVQVNLSTKTSGWELCNEYAGSTWIKKVNWTGNWEMYYRISNNPP